jgi:uncharacterized membrane protein
MNGAHLHLILNHLPVVLAPTALVVLILGVWRRNGEFVKLGLGLFVATGLLAVPAYLTGEPAEGIVARYSGVTTEAIERHESAATGALVTLVLAGLVGLAGLYLDRREDDIPRWLIAAAVLFGLLATVWVGVAANFGGHVRHQELRDTTTSR